MTTRKKSEAEVEVVEVVESADAKWNNEKGGKWNVLVGRADRTTHTGAGRLLVVLDNETVVWKGDVSVKCPYDDLGLRMYGLVLTLEEYVEVKLSEEDVRGGGSVYQLPSREDERIIYHIAMLLDGIMQCTNCGVPAGAPRPPYCKECSEQVIKLG
jgi:hypothetical protein